MHNEGWADQEHTVPPQLQKTKQSMWAWIQMGGQVCWRVSVCASSFLIASILLVKWEGRSEVESKNRGGGVGSLREERYEILFQRYGKVNGQGRII